METREDGRAAGSYESRNDLALRSAASDPTAEPRSNPQNAQSQPEFDAQSPKSKHSRKISMNRPQAGQPQPKDVPHSQMSKESLTSSKNAANQAMGTSLPDVIVRRNHLFDKLKRQRHAEILGKEKPEINVVLDLGLDKQGNSRPAKPVAAKAWESTPGSFLKHVDKDVSSDVVIAKVDGKELWDLDRPLEYGCRVSYVPFSSAEGRNVFWHSSAHVLGEACECQFNCLLSHGPPVEQGFFYDMAIGEGYASHSKMSQNQPADGSQTSSKGGRLGVLGEKSGTVLQREAALRETARVDSGLERNVRLQQIQDVLH